MKMTIEKMTIEKRYLLEFTEVVNAIADEVVIDFKKEPLSIEVTAVDPAHISMVSTGLNEEAIIEEDMEESVVMAGLNIKELRNLLDNYTNDEVTLEIKEGVLNIKRKGENYELVDTLELMNPDKVTAPNYPMFEYETCFGINSTPIKKYLKDIEEFTDKIEVRTKDGKFYMDTIKDEEDESIIDTKDRLLNRELTMKEIKYYVGKTKKSFGIYAVDYMKAVFENIEDDVELEIAMKIDYPMKIFYQYADGHGYARYIVAPRIET